MAHSLWHISHGILVMARVQQPEVVPELGRAPVLLLLEALDTLVMAF